MVIVECFRGIVVEEKIMDNPKVNMAYLIYSSEEVTRPSAEISAVIYTPSVKIPWPEGTSLKAAILN